MADTEKINAEALALHKKFHGKLEVRCKAPLENGHDLALAYTPGVAEPCRKIKENPDLSFEYTCRGNMVAVISDGTRVLGLGTSVRRRPCLSWKASPSFIRNLAILILSPSVSIPKIRKNL
ncbi:hypothetical protein M5E89_10970 [Acidaminococcus intestini]|nr:hypothetical protein M5E89_10970 [Acidaminococcus intestini]